LSLYWQVFGALTDKIKPWATRIFWQEFSKGAGMKNPLTELKRIPKPKETAVRQLPDSIALDLKEMLEGLFKPSPFCLRGGQCWVIIKTINGVAERT